MFLVWIFNEDSEVYASGGNHIILICGLMENITIQILLLQLQSYSVAS